ncbi:type II toxin-antitoxin system RelE/ParE family toxin [Lentzea tibetensis]|uniref:Type II toxin-antitoxin system RelE/ParE family toxin n=1 Tax=Lentzea tibetensis TaxID=2591470 RepID=A0A563EHE0_9PSEU|nr:type II toxin-antitoxin system RelE/ParE family toxin [Lentzea tibetensis]TWP45965.1 type II toxin-antitoxin system RelE/ParE family toxin [Lentzea tibetensis]
MVSGARQASGDENNQPKSAQAARRKWRWYRTESGRLIAREEFDALPERARAGLSNAIERYLTGQSRRNDIDSLGRGIYEIRHRYSNNHHRVLFTHWGQYCVALTAFYKNQPKTPKTDLNRAIDRARWWRDANGDEPGGG